MYIDDDSVVISGDLSLANYQILSMGLIKGANFQEYGGLFGTDGSGNVTAASYAGAGSGLTGIPATAIVLPGGTPFADAYGDIFGNSVTGVNGVFTNVLGSWWPWITDNSSGVVFGSGTGGGGDTPQYTWLINSSATAAKLNNAGLTVYGSINLGSSGTIVSTNGPGGSATVWIQTNSVGPHGLGLNFTNGLFILPVKTY